MTLLFQQEKNTNIYINWLNHYAHKINQKDLDEQTFKNKQSEKPFLYFNFINIFYSVIRQPLILKEKISQFSIKKDGNHHFNKKFNDYLSNDMILFSVELISNGYTPTIKQQEILRKKVNIKVLEDSNFIFKLNDLHYPIPEDLYLTWSLKFIRNSIDYAKYNNIIPNKFSQPGGTHHLVSQLNKFLIRSTKLFSNTFSNSDSSYGYINKTDDFTIYSRNLDASFSIIKDLRENVSLDDMLTYRQTINHCSTIIDEGLIRIQKKARKEKNRDVLSKDGAALLDMNKNSVYFNNFSSLLSYIDNMIQNGFIEEKKNIINDIRLADLNQYCVNKLHQKLDNNLLSLDNQLPKEAHNMISQITHNYNLLKKSTTNRDLNHIDLDKIYTEKLPDILNKYISIDPEYRLSLTNIQGKNAEELMIMSLSNVHEVLLDEIKNINKDKLSELSVVQRHTHGLKRKY